MQEKVSTSTKYFGVYVHIPFCAHRCSYCGFYQERPTKSALNHYIELLIKDIELQSDTPPADTIYWGGGTPTILSPDNISTLGQHMKKNDPLLEWSVECSPGTITPAKLQALKEIGVSRITMGVQSFNEKTMHMLGRRQQSRTVFEAYDMIRANGFNNIGIDLIFAVPNQTIEEWISDLEIAIAFSPEHISTYNLTYEGNSHLHQMQLANKLAIQNEEREIEFFTLTDQFLKDHGYEHYEISNFCKPGCASIHNIHTWEMQDWIGYGPSASSQFKNRRFTNIPSLKLWSEGIQKKQPNRCDIYALDEQTLVEDSLIFGLRMFQGVNLHDLQSRFPSANFQKYMKFFEKLMEEGLAELTENTIKLTIPGMLISDTIGSNILQL